MECQPFRKLRQLHASPCDLSLTLDPARSGDSGSLTECTKSKGLVLRCGLKRSNSDEQRKPATEIVNSVEPRELPGVCKWETACTSNSSDTCLSAGAIEHRGSSRGSEVLRNESVSATVEFAQSEPCGLSHRSRVVSNDSVLATSECSEIGQSEPRGLSHRSQVVTKESVSATVECSEIAQSEPGGLSHRSQVVANKSISATVECSEIAQGEPHGLSDRSQVVTNESVSATLECSEIAQSAPHGLSHRSQVVANESISATVECSAIRHGTSSETAIAASDLTSEKNSRHAIKQPLDSELLESNDDDTSAMDFTNSRIALASEETDHGEHGKSATKEDSSTHITEWQLNGQLIESKHASEESKETGGESCIEHAKSTTMEDSSILTTEQQLDGGLHDSRSEIDCTSAKLDSEEIKGHGEHEQRANGKPSEASSSSETIEVNGDPTKHPIESLWDSELVESNKDSVNQTDSAKGRTDSEGSSDTKSEDRDGHEQHESSTVKHNSNVVFAARDIRYYPEDSTSMPQRSGRTNDRDNCKRGWRDHRGSASGVKTTPEMTAPETNRNRQLFVGNLSYKVSNHDLYNFFGQFGPVHNCVQIRDHWTKKSKGFGFVTFRKEETAELAMKAPAHKRTLDGRVMVFDWAEPKKEGWLREASSGRQTGPQPKESVVNFDDVKCHFHTLPDEIFVEIFSYLNVKEKVLMERVCHRWRSVALNSWQSMKHLTFYRMFSCLKGHSLTDKVFNAILRRGCSELQSLDVSACPRDLTDFALSLIGIKCKKLTQLNISGVSVSTRSLKKLTENCSKLQWIQLQRCYNVGEKALWWLFHNCPDLRYIDIDRNARVTGECFYVLGMKLTTAMLGGCTKLTDNGIKLLTIRSPNLTKLDISCCVSITDQGLGKLVSNCVHLKQLVLGSCGPSVTPYGLFQLSKLLALEKLHLSQNSAVNDYVLGAIARQCNDLRVLDVSSCRGGITDAGIQCLVACAHLTQLNISYITDLTSDGISQLAQIGTLKKLIARYCIGVAPEGFIAVVSLCELQELDVSSCYQVGDIFLHKVAEVKPSNTHILLFVGGTSVTDKGVDDVQKSSTSIKICHDNLAHAHLIPDRDFSFTLDDDEDEDFGEDVESSQPTLTSEFGVVSSSVTAAGTFDEVSTRPNDEEELDEFGQYCEDFLEYDDPSMFPDYEDGWKDTALT